MIASQIWDTTIVNSSNLTAEQFAAGGSSLDGEEPVLAVSKPRLPTIDSVVGLMPGFVYVFNHSTYSNDYTNRSVAEHLGYSSEEISAFGPEMMMRIIHPDDQVFFGRAYGTDHTAGRRFCDQL